MMAARWPEALGAGYGAWFGALASVLGGRSLAAAAAFLGNFLVLLRLGPEVFATFYLLFTLMSLVAGLTGPAIDTTLVRFAARHRDDPDGALPYFKLVLHLKVAVLAATMLAAVLLASPLRALLFADTGPHPATAGMVVLAFFGGAVVSIWGFAQSYFLVREQFARYAGYEFCSSLLRLGLVLGLIWGDVGHPLAYLAAYVAAPLTMALLSWSELPRALFRARANWGAAPELHAFGRWVILASIFTTLAQRSDILLLGYIGVSSHQLGLYSAAVAMVLAGELVLLTFHSVLLPKASMLRDPGCLRQFIGRFRIPALLFCLPLSVMIPLVAFATRLPGPAPEGAWLPWLHALPSAHAYYGASGYFTILLLGVMTTIACAPAVTALYGLGHSGAICAFEGARLVLTLAAGAAGAAWFGAYGMAWAVACTRAGISAIGYVVAHQWVKREMFRAYAEGRA